MDDFLKQKWKVDSGRLRDYLMNPGNESVEMWASGSAALQFSLRADWKDSDLDLYVHAPMLDLPTILETGELSEVIDNMGFVRETSVSQETSQYRGFKNGFMTMNNILNIYTFRLRANEAIILQIVLCSNPVQDVVDNFDLTCCSIAWNVKTQIFYSSPDFPRGRMEMKLRDQYIAKYSEANLVTHRRVKKYNDRGFKLLNAPSLAIALGKIKSAILRLENNLFGFKQGLELFTNGISKRYKKFSFGEPPRVLQPIFRKWKAIRVENNIYRDTYFGEMEAKDLYNLYIIETERQLEFLNKKYKDVQEGRLDLVKTTRKIKIQNKLNSIDYKIKQVETEKKKCAKTLDEQVRELINKTEDHNEKHRLSRIYQLSKENHHDCDNPIEVFTQENVSDINPSRLFKRFITKFVDPNKFVTTCYDMENMRTYLRNLGREEKIWPDDRQQVEKIDKYRIEFAYETYKLNLKLDNFKLMRQHVSSGLIQEENKIEEMLIRGGAMCKKSQILNPVTNRCVLRSGVIGQRLLGKSPKRSPKKKSPKRSPNNANKSPRKSPSSELKWLSKFYLDLEKSIKLFNQDDYVIQYNGKKLSEKSLDDLVKKNKESLKQIARNAYLDLGKDKSYESDYPQQVLFDSNFFAKHKLQVIEK